MTDLDGEQIWRDARAPSSDCRPTREGVKKLFTALRTAFPDLYATIHDQVTEGNTVVTCI